MPDMDPESLINQLKKILEGFGVGGRSAPSSNDPGKYPRAHKVSTDGVLDNDRRTGLDELQLLHGAMKHKHSVLNRLMDEARISFYEAETAKAKFFRLGQDLFPDLAPDGEPCGFRTWKGDLYLVSWNRQEEEEGAES